MKYDSNPSTSPLSLHHRFARLGLAIPDLLLPSSEVDLSTWAVVACDQYSDNPSYWQEVASIVGDSPSTLNLIIPEVYLSDAPQRKEAIIATLQHYLQHNIIVSAGSIATIVARTFNGGRVQHGIVMAVDLECFDWQRNKGIIRSSEQVIPERIEPRLMVRAISGIELTHTLLLYSDPSVGLRQVMEYLYENAKDSPLYQSDLMLGGGHIRAWALRSTEEQSLLASVLEQAIHTTSSNGVHFMIGDGNHSLAAAATHWQQLKSGGADPYHPARYALVELINIHDEGVEVKPIHRLIYGAPLDSLVAVVASHLRGRRVATTLSAVDASGDGATNEVYLQWNEECHLVVVPNADPAVVYLESILAKIREQFPALTTLYVHGIEELTRLHRQHGGIAFRLPPINKSKLIEYVGTRGAMPPKSFSLGEAHEKRYYLEGRFIEPTKI